MAQTQVQNKRGEWVPAIPEPLWVGVGLIAAQCDCGEKFVGLRGKHVRERSGRKYREHYALVHVLGLD